MQIGFLCTVHRKLCHWHRFLCTVHRKFLPIFGKMFHLELRTNILAHFKGPECEILFLKFHFLFEVFIHKFQIIMSRRKWNFKKADPPPEPLKCARILVLGSKWKFNVLQKLGKYFLCNIHRNMCTMHRFLCTVHRKLICKSLYF